METIAKMFGAAEPKSAAIRYVEGLGRDETNLAKALLGTLRDQITKYSKGVPQQAVFAGRHGVAPPIDLTVFDRMYEQTSWVRASVGVITKAVTAKGWSLHPLRPDADPRNAKSLREFFAAPNPQDTFVEILDDITRD
ncbi:MAG: hypothetical protein ABII00_04140, partial [Elusimicrobiota bacterium]